MKSLAMYRLYVNIVILCLILLCIGISLAEEPKVYTEQDLRRYSGSSPEMRIYYF